jgi:hypothetical protein
MKSEYILLSFIALAMAIYPVYMFQAFALSPSFPRQQIEDGDGDWYWFSQATEGKEKRSISTEDMENLTGDIIGDIRSVSYVSDGKTLNVTFWLTSPFDNIPPPKDHRPSYNVVIDPNPEVGSNSGYISRMTWDNDIKRWITIFGETSGETPNEQIRVLETNNYTAFNKSSNTTDDLFEPGRGYNVFLSVNLASLNYPTNYRMIFYISDWLESEDPSRPLIGQFTGIRVFDYTNTVHLPSPQFTIFASPVSTNITQGENKNIRIGIQSLQPVASFRNDQPNIKFFSNNTDGIKFDFAPSQATIVPFTKTATSELNIHVPKNAIADVHTIPIFATVSFPSEFFGNPSENITTSLDLTIAVKEPLPWYEILRQGLSDWTEPLTVIPTTIVSIITGLLGLGIGTKLKKKK